MPVNKQKVEVIKVNCDRPVCRPKKFPRMPIMYLELIENKDKIKQDMINKEYTPPLVESSDVEDTKTEVLQDTPNFQEASENIEEAVDILSDKNMKEEYIENRVGGNSRTYSKNTNEKLFDDSKISDSELSDREDGGRSDMGSVRDYRSNYSKETPTIKSAPDRGRIDYPSEDSDYRISPDRASISDSEGSDDDISKKIKKLLKKERSRDRSAESYNSKSRSRNYSPPREGAKPYDKPHTNKEEKSKTRDNSGGGDDKTETRNPPTLSELKSKGQYVERKAFRNITIPTVNEQEEEDLKRELLFKFELLKKSYKSSNIPEFTVHSDYNTMLKSYNMTLRQVSLDNNVENYKQYLMAGFMAVEFLGNSFLKLDMSGFTQQQMVNMGKYERLLIELGEKSYVPEAKSLPVELRLLFMILMNAGVFIVTKMIMKKTGSNLANIFGSTSRPSGNTNSPNFPNSEGSGGVPRKRKMNGPDINLDDLPDIKN